jgi:hypothetical protein
MNLKCYRYYSNETHLDFEFDSDGPRGMIRKVVRYTLQNADGISYFNLGFGDLNKTTGKIDDLAVTDNQDREKILATVAATVLAFTMHFPGAMVYATGSTPARTRLYQMGISANWTEIATLLYVYGYEQNIGWQPFQKNVRYVAFLVKRK